MLAQICELLGAAAAVFPAAEVTAKNHIAYARMLQDIPLPVLKTAIEQCMVESRFYPSVAEIRERAAKLQRPEIPTPLEAWATVTKTMGKFGFYKAVSGMEALAEQNPIAAAAVRCLGWKELCNSENQIADRAHFMKVYEQLVQRQEADQRLLPAAREMRALVRGTPVIAQLTERKR